jgi:hypothetical protein
MGLAAGVQLTEIGSFGCVQGQCPVDRKTGTDRSAAAEQQQQQQQYGQQQQRRQQIALRTIRIRNGPNEEWLL